MAFYKYKYKNKTSNSKNKKSSYMNKMKKKIFSKSYKQETPYISFEKRVQNVIRRNIEDKVSNNYILKAPVAGWGPLNFGPQWFSLRNFLNNDLNLSQGVQQNQRIGNRILLKHLYLNILITPAQGGDTKMDLYLANSQMGYLTVYVCKQKNNEGVPVALDNFLQLGNNATTPNGSFGQIMFTENKDRYKIFFKKTFKCGASQGKGITGIESNFMTSNNDFKINHILKLDIAKYIKNKFITFNDNDTVGLNSELQPIAVVATWTPYLGSLAQGVQYVNSYFELNTASWAVYEDA